VSGPLLPQVLSRSFTSLPPFLELSLFLITLIEGFVGDCQGLLFWPVFPIGVHGADESVISPRTCFMDLFTLIVRVFLDSLRLAPCS